jgi:peptidoglycan/xylan/chitin deacetylase (PgdA/CDA1 family)
MRAVRTRSVIIAVLAGFTGLGGALFNAPAHAEECPGNPNALGTSRTLVLEPGDVTRIGAMQYSQALPLKDKEVVLTFDDGPIPPYSTRVLDILASECIKVTYFLVGEMAHAHPALVRRIYEEGHTIGTHSEDHPSRFQKLPVDRLRWEIDQGIADVSAALGDNRELAPFFRIPGLARTDIIERELSARSLVVFSSDTVADDWHRRIRPKDIISRAVSRLEARGKGILLLHDIHQSTVLALPGLFKELKDKGFHIVHVVAGSGHAVETASVPPWINDRSDPSWPQNLSGPESNRIALPVPDAKSFDTGYLPRQKVMLADRTAGAAYLASAGATDWSDPSKTETAAREPRLPVPDVLDIGPALDGWPTAAEPIRQE